MATLSIIVLTCVKCIETYISCTSLIISATMVAHFMSFLTDKQVVSSTSVYTFQELDRSNIDYVTYLEWLALLVEATQGSRAVYRA